MPLRKFGKILDRETLITTPTDPRLETVYIAVGENDQTAVTAQAYSLIPSTVITAFGLLHRQPIQLERIGHQIFEVAVSYTRRRWGSLEWTITGRTTGATQHIRGSLRTTGSSKNAPNFGQLIGVREDGSVEGAEIPFPVLDYAIEVVYPLGELNLAKMNAWADLTGRTNLSPWMGRAPGEVLYQGAEFQDGTEVPARVTHFVSVQPNIENANIAGLNGISKKGWEFLWFRTKRQVVQAGGQDVEVVRAEHWYTEQVHLEGDFAGVLGFGG